MSLEISKRCISALYHQPVSLASPSGIPRALGYNVHKSNFRRGYSVTATKPKKTASAGTKSTPQNVASKSAKSATKQTAKGPLQSQRIPGDLTSSTSTAAQPSGGNARKASKHMTGGMSYKVPEKREALTEEEQMQQVDQIIAMAKFFPTADPWGQRVDTLDVTIPHSVKFNTRKNYPGWGAMFDQFRENRYNAAKNATSMLLLAQSDAVPNRDLSNATRRQKFFQWPWRIFTTTSVKPGSWLAPFRETALTTYQQLNTALALKDDKTVRQLTTSTYQDSMLRLLRKSQNPGIKNIWRFHKEVTPLRVISIRGTEGYLAPEDPKFGNRMMVHALVRIDTEQSLETYDRRGVALHAPPADINNTGVTKLQAVGNTPAERRRVTEYLVFEKRMWYDGPWVIREQLWEKPGREAAI